MKITLKPSLIFNHRHLLLRHIMHGIGYSTCVISGYNTGGIAYTMHDMSQEKMTVIKY